MEDTDAMEDPDSMEDFKSVEEEIVSSAESEPLSLADIENIDKDKQLFAYIFCKEIMEHENIFVCPLSTEIIVAMAHQGAAGETAEKLAKILNVENRKAAVQKYQPLIQLLNNIKNYSLNIAYKIFIMKDFPLKRDFENVIQESFMSKIDPIDFSDNKKPADDINQWVESKTKNKIKNLISPDCLNESTRLVLVNAVYFESSWAKPFSKEDTTLQCFKLSKDEFVDCEMMYICDDFKYCSDVMDMEVRLLELPCSGNIVSIIIFLPNKYADIKIQQIKLAKMDLSTLMSNAKTERVDVFLPKFKIETTTNVKPLLENMEFGVISNPDAANFFEISESPKPLYVSEIIQKTLIEVHEGENEPVPVTESSDTDNIVKFLVNSPFLFLVQALGENGNTVWCTGKVTNPTL